jgi:hypothetical protein
MARKKPRRLTQEEKEELIRRSRQGGNNPAGGRPVETDPDRLFANRRKDKKDDGDEGKQIPLDMLKTKDKEQHRRGIRAAAKAGKQRMWDELGIGGTAPMPKYTGSGPEEIADNKRLHRTTLRSSGDFDARTKELADQRVKEYYKTLRDAGLDSELAQRQTMRQVNDHDLRATGSTKKGRERTMHRIDDMGKIIPFTQTLQKAFGLQKSRRTRYKAQKTVPGASGGRNERSHIRRQLGRGEYSQKKANQHKGLDARLARAGVRVVNSHADRPALPVSSLPSIYSNVRGKHTTPGKPWSDEAHDRPETINTLEAERLGHITADEANESLESTKSRRGRPMARPVKHKRNLLNIVEPRMAAAQQAEQAKEPVAMKRKYYEGKKSGANRQDKPTEAKNGKQIIHFRKALVTLQKFLDNDCGCDE